MNTFWYKGKDLCCEAIPIAVIAEKVGTPFYLYSQTALECGFKEFDSAFATLPHLTCYAVKANSNLAILALLRRLGAGFDIVSGGELLRALKAGADPMKIVFSGVGKTEWELDLGLGHEILQFNVESQAELQILEARARALGRVARVALRVNPDVDPQTHPYVSTGLRQNKFGVSMEEAHKLCRRIRRSRQLKLTGIGFHIGSQITRLEPFVSALSRLREILPGLRAAGAEIRHLDLGGGLGITYGEESPPRPLDYNRAIYPLVQDLGCTILFEPGRVIVGNAGILVTRVLLTKQMYRKNFVVVDAGMNDLIRPSLYGSYHCIRPVRSNKRGLWRADVVGPVCESGDFLARDREMQVARKDDLLAVMTSGAYGMVLASNYNSRPRAAEIMVKGRRMKLIRRRESFEDLVCGERANAL